jgi:hypothetical protein
MYGSQVVIPESVDCHRFDPARYPSVLKETSSSEQEEDDSGSQQRGKRGRKAGEQRAGIRRRRPPPPAFEFLSVIINMLMPAFEFLSVIINMLNAGIQLLFYTSKIPIVAPGTAALALSS